MIAAKEAADAAEVRCAEEERRAKEIAAKVRTVVAKARHSAGEIVIAAAAEAEATRRRSSGIGVKFGAMFNGVMNAILLRSPAAVAERVRSEEREKMRPELERISGERDYVAAELRRVEERAQALAASVSGLGQQRDAARHELNLLRQPRSASSSRFDVP
jgi:hypothetical protein